MAITSRPTLGSKRKMNGLDGLRAIAVLAVIAYHLKLSFIPGGLLGVSIFFVLSGYLITDILLNEWHDAGHISLKNFWLRRIRRLVPGMLAMTAVVTVWLLFTDTDRLISLRGDIAAGILYISNWWYIFHDVSYFESFGPPSPFGHFWSLAVEEQFYVLWPLLLIGSIQLLRKKGRLLVFIIVLAEISAGAMVILYNPDLDPSRIYYGTDTRAFSLLIGAALAVVWPSRRLSGTLRNRNRVILDLSGVAAFILLLYMMFNISEYDPKLYYGGMVFQSLVAALLVAVLAHPSSDLARLIGAKPMRWIGERSYGLYLWHYPVIILSTPAVHTAGVQPIRMIVQVIATLVLASLSLKYIENPIRKDGFRQSWIQLRENIRLNSNNKSLWWKRSGLLLSAVLLCYFASQQTHHTTDIPPASPVVQPSPAPVPQIAKPEHPPVTAADTEAKPAENEETAKLQYTIVGDSVILDAKPYLEQKISSIHIDGHIGRQMSQVAGVLNELKQNNQLGSQVILELGTNGSFNSKSLNSQLDNLKDKTHVYLVTVRVPRPWEKTVNKALNKAASAYSNVSLIDWYSMSRGHDEYFDEDGVHLTEKGSKAFAALIQSSLNS